jgi:hypothetical protein
MFCGAFCSWVLREVGLDGVNIVKAKLNKKNGDIKVEVVIFGQEMQERTSLSKVMNPTEASGPTRVSEVFKRSSIYIYSCMKRRLVYRFYLLCNKLFLMHRFGDIQIEILDFLGRM